MPRFRQIPSIEHLRQRDALRPLEAEYGRDAVLGALRAEADAMRARLAAGDDPTDVALAIEQGLPARLRAQSRSLLPVLNATGVVVHTNLGRAPLAQAAASRIAELAVGYTNLEYDLALGIRGARDAHAERLLCRLTGAPAAVVVNNNAAATMLTLAALARGREVVISRGELVEIGGGFRVPDVMAQSGAVLREVGTTNRTRVADYAAALSDRTALILRVHPSNFRISGFTERPALAALAALGRQFSIPVAEDLGSGYLRVPENVPALAHEPAVQDSLTAGADVVTFSGDKLLGGPQSGIIAGSQKAVGLIRRHPLMRAFRVDKLTYAALEATLEEYAAGRAGTTVPVPRMIAMTPAEIEPRARRLAAALEGSACEADVVDGQSTIGGGSAPESALETRLVAIQPSTMTPDALATALRIQQPPVVVRIDNDRVLLDLRTILPEQDDVLTACVRAALSALDASLK